MFAGPTGVGKTWTAQVLGDCFETKVIYRCQRHLECGFQVSEEERDEEDLSHCPAHKTEEKAMVPLERIKLPNLLWVRCVEMGGSMYHAVNKLMGSPPSYAGHGSTPPLFLGGKAPRVVLFDEVEKAILAEHWSEGKTGLTDLLHAILEEGRITNNYNQEVDFTGSIIILTSNLGGERIVREVGGGFGFATDQQRRSITRLTDEEVAQLNKDICRLVEDAVKQALPPELFNRLDDLIVFRFLTRTQYHEIFDLEFRYLQERIAERARVGPFSLNCTSKVKDLIVEESIEKREYGARPFKRVIERQITAPLAVLINNGQIKKGDRIEAHLENGEIVFHRLDIQAQKESHQRRLKEETSGARAQ